MKSTPAADVLLDVARRAAREVDVLALVRRPVRGLQILGEPRRAILPIASPDITLGPRGGLHDLERRERHAPLVLDQPTAELHPRRLDRQRLGTADVAQLARRAREERVDHLLAHLFLVLEVFAQEEPLAARRLALPTAAVELVAFVDAVAALGARVGVLDDVGGDPALVAMATLVGLALHAVGEEADEGLERLGCAHRRRQHAGADHLARIHDAFGIGVALELLQTRERVRPEHLARLVAEVEACAVGTPAVMFGNLDHAECQPEREVVTERALVLRDEPEQHDLGLVVRTTGDRDAVEHERLIDLRTQILQRRAQARERNHDLGGHERGTEALDAHDAEAVVPLVTRELFRESLTAARRDQLVESWPRGHDVRRAHRERHEVADGHRDVVLVRVRARWAAIRELDHRGIDEPEGPDREFCGHDPFEQRGEGHRIRTLHPDDRERLLLHHAQRDLRDEPGDALRTGDHVEVGAVENADVARGKYQPGRDHVVAKPAELVGPIARAALGKPATNRRRRIRARI